MSATFPGCSMISSLCCPSTRGPLVPFREDSQTSHKMGGGPDKRPKLLDIRLNIEVSFDRFQRPRPEGI